MNDKDRIDTADDAWIETLLREDAARQPHLADGGFSDRLLTRLPAPRRVAPGWIVPASAVLGGLLALGVTPAGAWLAHEVPALLDARHAAPALLASAMLVYALMFGAARER